MLKGAAYRATATCSSKGVITAYTPTELVRSAEMLMLGFAATSWGSYVMQYPA